MTKTEIVTEPYSKDQTMNSSTLNTEWTDAQRLEAAQKLVERGCMKAAQVHIDNIVDADIRQEAESLLSSTKSS